MSETSLYAVLRTRVSALETELEDLRKTVHACASAYEVSKLETRLDSLESRSGTPEYDIIHRVWAVERRDGGVVCLFHSRESAERDRITRELESSTKLYISEYAVYR